MLSDIETYSKELYENLEVSAKKSNVLIQRYLEHPLIILNRKFDIRQWILVTSFDPLQAWIFDGCYFRFSGEDFTLDCLDDFVHLTNHSVQAKGKI
jgi:tubulin monoglycylase TTLL3/8